MMSAMLPRALFFCSALFLAASAFCAALPLERIQLPGGFHIEVLARVPNAREMVFGDNNVLYVGSMQEGKVHALVLDKNYQAQKLYVVASGLHLPAGVAYRDGSLYVSAVERILRFDDIEKHLADLPKDTHHGWRFIAFGHRWLAVRPGRGALQHLRAGSRALRGHLADATGWIAVAGVCSWDTQYGWVRLGSKIQRAMVHRQWARHVGGRHSAR